MLVKQSVSFGVLKLASKHVLHEIESFFRHVWRNNLHLQSRRRRRRRRRRRHRRFCRLSIKTSSSDRFKASLKIGLKVKSFLFVFLMAAIFAMLAPILATRVQIPEPARRENFKSVGS